MRKRTIPRRLTASLLLVTLTTVLTGPVIADPPSWAPAHGYRDKHKHEHHDDGDERYPTNSYLVNGHCNRAALGAVLGGVAGGVVGASVGKADDRTAATVIGAVIGAVAGGSIGHSMDEADRYCTGQTLEYAQDQHPVSWRNPDDGRSYIITPTRTYQDEGRYCREYTTKSTLGGRTQQIQGSACRMGDGRWQTMND